MDPAPDHTIPQLLTIEQLAERLELSVDALRARAERGVIPGKVKVGKSVRFRADIIRDWLDQQTVTHLESAS